MLWAVEVAGRWVPARKANEVDSPTTPGSETGPQGVGRSASVAVSPAQNLVHVRPGDLVFVGVAALPEVDAVARLIDLLGLVTWIHLGDIHRCIVPVPGGSCQPPTQ
jgi:hypothetical protein